MENNRAEVLEQIRSDRGLIRLAGEFRMTKSTLAVDETVERDFLLVERAQTYLRRHPDFSSIKSYYQMEKVDFALCMHVPVHFLLGSRIGEDNVFIYLRSGGQVFSLEFIDVSLKLMRELVFPAIRERFVEPETIISCLMTELETKLYLSSYLHELAHMRPPFSFIPVANPKLKLPMRDTAIWGEYFADTSMAFSSPTSDLFEIVLMTKIFWYLERHMARPEYAIEGITDNDAFEGLVLLEQALASGYFEVQREKLRLNHARRGEFISSIALLRRNFEENFEELSPAEQMATSEAVKALFCRTFDGKYFPRESTMNLFKNGDSACAIC